MEVSTQNVITVRVIFLHSISTHVSQAIDQLYGGQVNPSVQKQIQDWLHQAQKAPSAWAIAWDLLQQSVNQSA